MSVKGVVAAARARTGIDPVIAGILAFFVAHMLVRIFGTSNFSVDDTETAVRTQIFQLHYSPDNPPLFDWLFFGLSQLMGVSNVTVQLLRTVALTGAGVFLFLAARRGFRHRVALDAAIVGYGATAFYGWDIFQQFSHTVTLIFSMGLALFALTRVARSGRLADYALLGLGLGLGILSKYLFALYFVALVVASLRLPTYRPAILSLRLLLTFAVAALVASPLVYGLWETLPDLAADLGGQVSGSDGGGPDLASFGYLLLLTAEFWLPLIVILWLSLWRWPAGEASSEQAAAPDEDFHGLVWGATIVMVAAMFVSVLLGTKIVEGRYLVVILSLLPMAIFTAVDRRLPFPALAVENFRRAAMIFIVGVLVFRFLTFLLTSPPFCLPRCVLFVDYRPVAEKIEAAGEKQAIILTHHVHIAANLLRYLSNARVAIDPYTGESDLAVAPPAERNCFAVWFQRYGQSETTLTDALQRAIGRPPTAADLAAIGPPEFVTVGWQTKLPWDWGPRLMWAWGPATQVGVARIDSAAPICDGRRSPA